METTYLLVGGDRRQFWLSRLLVPRGRVYTLGVPGLEDDAPETVSFFRKRKAARSRGGLRSQSPVWAV